MEKLGFGFMRLPLTNSDDPTSVDKEILCRMVDSFLENGFNYFDTAYMYHNFKSETALRETLVKRHPRTSFTVASKLPTMFLKAPEDQERIFNEQLEKCGVDYFDYYLLHNLNNSHYKIALEMDSFSFVQSKKREGKIRKVGFSFHDNADLLDDILSAHPEMEFVQLQINYMDWENQSIQSRKCYEVARKHNKPVIVMEPVKGGTLAKVPEEAEKSFKDIHPRMSVASWALRFAAGQEGVMTVLSGMSDMDQLTDNMSFMKDFKPLNTEELTAVERAVDIINESIAVPCTACQYCVDDCPSAIPIPNYFALYNTEMLIKSNGMSIQRVYYNNYAGKLGKASDCIECRVCESLCPQHIGIVEGLKSVAATFES